MRILVVGAGATGGYFGGRLMQAGRDVTFLVRPARAAQLRADGLHIVSPHGDLDLSPALVTAEQIGGPFDIILLSVKAYALDAAIADMAPAVGAQTLIVPLLNGMRHIDVLEARFGAGPVLGGVCRIMATLDPQGRILQFNRVHDLVYGERGVTGSDRLGRLDAQLRGAGFDAAASTTIVQDMWDKWVMLAALGGITTLLRGTVGEIEAAPGGAALALALRDECAAIAAAQGYPPGGPLLARVGAMLTQAGSSLASSMYRDLQRGAEVEADQIIGDLLARGAQAGVATPLLQAARAGLAIYQSGRAARQPSG